MLFNANSAIFQLYHGENMFIFSKMVMRSAELDFYIVLTLKQQSAGKHVAPLWHIIMIPSQPVISLSPWCCVLSRETINTNFIFIVFSLTQPELESTIYCTQGEHANHYATDIFKFDCSVQPVNRILKYGMISGLKEFTTNYIQHLLDIICLKDCKGNILCLVC